MERNGGGIQARARREFEEAQAQGATRATTPQGGRGRWGQETTHTKNGGGGRASRNHARRPEARHKHTWPPSHCRVPSPTDQVPKRVHPYTFLIRPSTKKTDCE